MTQMPPCGPESNELFNLACDYVQDLQRLTENIRLQSEKPLLPTLSQLIFQREERLNALTALNWELFSPEQQSILLVALQNCQAMDPEIGNQLNHLREQLEAQIQGLTTSKALIDKYKINQPGQTGHYSKDA